MAKQLEISFSKAGIYTSLQDQGRNAFQHFGVPNGGAMDIPAFNRANALVGNAADEPAIELTLTGPEIYFSKSCQIAITGAEIQASINGLEIANHTKHVIPAKAVLKFSNMTKGARAYLAINGSWNVKKWLGSVSPVKNIFENHIIKKGRVIQILDPTSNPLPLTLKTPMISHKIRWLPGPEYNKVGARKVNRFLKQGQKVMNDSNRMGLRLASQESLDTHFKEIISSAVIPGTIQLLPNGQIVLLLKDAQTIGGYPRIAIVYSDDIDMLAQYKPGDYLFFEAKNWLDQR